jgi:kynurenine formamidase
MCHHCVVDGIKQDMLSRRSLFKRGAALATGAAAAAALAKPVFSADMPAFSKPYDLTHELHEHFPTYFGEQQLFVTQKFNYAEHKFNLFELRINEHTGTHMDAPLHFSPDGTSVAEIPVDNLIAPLVVVDIREKASANADAQVTPDDIKTWIAANGPLPAGCCVAMNSGWDQHVSTDKFRNADADKKLHFPGFHIEATKMLIEDGNATGIAVDTLSLDFGLSPDFATHYAWLPSGRWGLECVSNLGAMPAKGATLFVGAPKVRGGSGGPCRVIAVI